MGFKEAIRTCLIEKYATFQGRASRSEYWYFVLFVCLVSFLPIVIGAVAIALPAETTGEVSSIAPIFLGVGGLIYLALIIPIISVYVRRFHDRNISGWWVLGVMIGSAIPYFGIAFSIGAFVVTVLKGTEGENHYGLDPLAAETEADVFA